MCDGWNCEVLHSVFICNVISIPGRTEYFICTIHISEKIYWFSNGTYRSPTEIRNIFIKSKKIGNIYLLIIITGDWYNFFLSLTITQVPHTYSLYCRHSIQAGNNLLLSNYLLTKLGDPEECYTPSSLTSAINLFKIM